MFGAEMGNAKAEGQLRRLSQFMPKNHRVPVHPSQRTVLGQGRLPSPSREGCILNLFSRGGSLQRLKAADQSSSERLGHIMVVCVILVQGKTSHAPYDAALTDNTNQSLCSQKPAQEGCLASPTHRTTIPGLVGRNGYCMEFAGCWLQINQGHWVVIPRTRLAKAFSENVNKR